MFKLKLYRIPKGEERVDIYYSEMTPAVDQIVAVVKAGGKPLSNSGYKAAYTAGGDKSDSKQLSASEYFTIDQVLLNESAEGDRKYQNERPVLYGVYEDEKFLLEIEDIYYFDTVDRRTFAYGKSSVYQLGRTLSMLEQELKPYGFVRINKSILVNIYQIKKIKPEPNMKIIAILKNNEKLQINRGYKRSFEDYLNEVRRCI